MVVIHEGELQLLFAMKEYIMKIKLTSKNNLKKMWKNLKLLVKLNISYNNNHTVEVVTEF